MANELILIVEDNPKNLKLVRDTLQVKGYRTIEAGTGEDGVQMAHEQHPALVLMDIQLPGISGIVAFQQLRADPDTRGIPIIAVTASVMAQDRQKIMAGRLRRLSRQAHQCAGVAQEYPNSPRQVRPVTNLDRWDRRRFVLTSLAGAFAAPRGVEAQPVGRIARIGTLTTSPAERASHYILAFEEALQGLGYVKGSHIIYEHRFAEGRVERMPELARDLATLNVDVIVAGNNASISAAQQATSKIPIVMTYGADPVGVGFVRSLARPKGNITGLTADVSDETWAKRLEFVKDVAPRVSHVAILWNPDFPGAASAWKATATAAATRRLRLQSIEVRRLEDFEAGFAAIVSQHPGALLVLADPLTYTRRREIVVLAARQHIPTLSAFRETTDEGGLLSYGPNIPGLWRRAAYFVDRILKGAKPGDLPIEQPTKFELVINLKTAKALGLTIPPSLLARADQVIDP